MRPTMQHRMWRYLVSVPALALPPLGTFLGPYLMGYGVLRFETGGPIYAFSVLLLPFGVSTLFAALPRASLLARGAWFLGTLLVQFLVIFTIVPDLGHSQVIGIAHRYRAEYPLADLQACADTLRKKHASNPAGDSLGEDAAAGEPPPVTLSEAELPPARIRCGGDFMSVARGHNELPARLLRASGTDSRVVCRRRMVLDADRTAPGFVGGRARLHGCGR
jgi:hypothetical protein